MLSGPAVTVPWYTWFQQIDRALQAGELSAEDLAAAIALISRALGSPTGSAQDIDVRQAIIDNLPQSLRRFVDIDGPGIVVKTSSNDVVLRAVAPGIGIEVTNGNGEAGDPTVSLEPIADDGTGALLAITRDAYGRVQGTKVATITGTAGRIVVTNGDASAGLPTIDLATVPNAGGGELLRIVRDAYGRLTGTSAATTDDLAEGTGNVYFTTERAQDAVGMAIAAGTGDGATMTYDDAGNRINIANTDKGSFAVAAHVALPNPHPQYALAPSGTGTAANFHRGDNTYSETLTTTTVPVFMGMNSNAGVVADHRFFSNNVVRWVFRKSSDAETGSNAGSHFQVNRYSDAGSFIDTPLRIDRQTGALSSGVDNVHTHGTAVFRIKELFCGTNVINTSDAREKTEVRPFNAAELAAAMEIAGEIGIFQWLDAIARKGHDARLHAGMTVQRMMEIMSGHGLNPMHYGMICYDEWAAFLDMTKEGVYELNEAGEWVEVAPPEFRTIPAGDRYSFRTDQLHAFALRGMHERVRAHENRIEAIEALLNL